MRAPCILKRHVPFRTNTLCYCQWCATTGQKKRFYKLRDGPIDWFFCNEECALQWLDYRFSCPAVNQLLRCTPGQRNLNGLPIDEWVSKQISEWEARCARRVSSPS